MKRIVMVIGLAAGAVRAQPAPAEPAPPSKDERAGQDESLPNGDGARPWAQGVSDAEQKAALASFHDGNVQLNDGLFARAADRYREALQHWDHPAIHYNLALALMNVDQPIEAYEHLQAAVKFGDAPLQSKDKYDHAKDYLLLLGKQLADVEVGCDKPGAKVSVDGREVFVAPGKYGERVRVGKHTFVAEKQGYNARVNAPYVGPGEHFRIELKLYTADELTRYHRRWSATWLPYAVAGGGLALGAAAAVFEVSAQHSYRDYDAKVKACNQNDAGCPQSAALTDLRNTGDTKKTLGYIGYGLAAAAFASAGVVWYVNRPEAYQIRVEDLPNERGEPTARAGAARAARGAVTVAPVVTPGYAGAAVQGGF
jgi:hypothetical protein